MLVVFTEKKKFLVLFYICVILGQNEKNKCKIRREIVLERMIPNDKADPFKAEI